MRLYKRVCPSVASVRPSVRPSVTHFFRIRDIAYFWPERWIQSGGETHACTQTRARAHTNTHTHARKQTYTHKRAAKINELAEPQWRGIAKHTHSNTHIYTHTCTLHKHTHAREDIWSFIAPFLRKWRSFMNLKLSRGNDTILVTWLPSPFISCVVE